MNAFVFDQLRHDWTREEILALHEMPFLDLLFEAQRVHRRYHAANTVQLSQLLSIKTGGCPEDCGYCPQSQKFAADTGLKASKLMDIEAVLTAARAARDAGATRFCMGAAWTRPKDKDLETVAEMVEGVRALGLETCVTLGMLEERQAQRLAEAGLDYYNHNIDTSPEYYKDIITTRTFDERLETLEHVRAAGINVCCGGIVGMGETREDRAGMIAALAALPEHPQSVPINRLVRVKGTPLSDTAPEIEGLEFVRTIAIARLTMPKSMVRLSAGRETMSDELQALCFMAGASSIFYGEKLLTTPNPRENRDVALFKSLGLTAA
ncbi:MAG: biotin synthase BioB [Alphaproteobacteria bacterium]|nr:biotin synthase BioB [Alphaproteobacteria bacterium]